MTFLIDTFRYVVQAVGAAWNLLDKSVETLLSNGNLVAEIASWIDEGGVVRGTVARSTGKYYFEVTFLDWGARVGGSPGIGIARSVNTITTLEGAPFGTGTWITLAYGYWYLFQNGANVAYANDRSANVDSANPTPGFTIGFAVDLTAKRMWIRHGGRGFGSPGNPELNQFPHMASIAAGDVKPYAYLTFSDDAGSPHRDKLQINMGESPFVYAAPVGFQSWDGTRAAPTNPVVSRAGTIPSSIATCTMYWDFGDKSGLFANDLRTAIASDDQSIAVGRLKNNTSRGWRFFNGSKTLRYDDLAFPGYGGAVYQDSGRLNEPAEPWYMQTLTTSVSIAFSTFFGASAGVMSLALKFGHASLFPYPGESASLAPVIVGDEALYFGLMVTRPPGPTGATHVRLSWFNWQAALTTYYMVHADVPIGTPVIVTCGLRSGQMYIRVNGVLVQTRASAAFADRSYPPVCFQHFPTNTADFDVWIRDGAMWSTAVSDANLLLAEKYIASGVGLAL